MVAKRTNQLSMAHLLPLLSLLVLQCSVAIVSGQESAGNSSDFAGGMRMAPDQQQSTTVKRALGTEAPPFETSLADDLKALGPLPEVEGATGDISQLLPDTRSLFNKDAVDPTTLNDVDCHMRNLDLCYAGLLAQGAKFLPETDAELESRCDEMKAVMSCISVYNQRCQTLKVFSAVMPMSQVGQARSMLPKELLEFQLPVELLKSDPKSGGSTTKIRAIDLMDLCEPKAKGTKANRELRQRIFELSKCIMPRMQLMKPCIEDLKTALQLFYEPRRVLPFEPSCCAVSQFRACSQKALDGMCGISSFEQLESSLYSGPGGQMFGTLQQACKRRALSYETNYCREILPASGVKAPERRGRKASKLAKVLDLFTFVPAQ